MFQFSIGPSGSLGVSEKNDQKNFVNQTESHSPLPGAKFYTLINVRYEQENAVC